MKIIIFTLLLLVINITQAEEIPFSQSPMQFYKQAVDDNDSVLLVRTAARCTALYSLIATAIERNFSDKSYVEYSQTADFLLVYAVTLNRKIYEQRGIKGDKLEIADSNLMSEIKTFFNAYDEWSKANLVSHGQMFGTKTPHFISDIRDCSSINSILKQ